MRRVLILLLALLLLSACAAPAETEEAPPVPEVPEAAAPEEESPEDPEEEDHVLLTLDAPLADGRTLRLEAFGRQAEAFGWGVGEVRVYDGTERIQTISSREAIEEVWGVMDESPAVYTNCWSPKETMEVLDLNFDGNTDFGLFGWTANNTIPYYYWIWDAETEQYQYAFTLQGAEAHPETGELTAGYKSGSAGSQWITEVYRPDESGGLYLVRVERDTCDFEPDSGLLDVSRGWARETWAPPEGGEPISPGNDRWSIEANLALLRREVPVVEIHGETTSHYTEIWEFKNGERKLTSREEYFYEEQPE